MSTDKAVALAEKHGATVVGTVVGNLLLLAIAADDLAAMLAGHKQQVRDEYREELVAKAGKMPRLLLPDEPWVKSCPESEVREAIAAMQAKLEKQYEATVTVLASHGTIRRKLEQSEARVAELEKDAAQEEERTNNLHLFLSSLPYLNSPISIQQVLDNWKTRNEQYERKAGLLWSRERGLGAMNKEQP